MKTITHLSNNLIEYKILDIDKKYREFFKDNIIEAKKLTHSCQFECYNFNKNNLDEAEKCARNCFMPMIHIKKNIAKLVESCKDKFEECKVKARNNYDNNISDFIKIEECLNLYQEELYKTKEEAEYIYAGYMKNFSNLINNVKNQNNEKK